MRIDPITGEVHIADACGNEWDTGDLDSAGNFFTPDRIANEANDVRKFSDADIRHVAYHLDRSGILEMIKQWRAEDRAGAHPGGRPASIDDRAIILLTFLLFATRNGFLIQELAKMVAHNLDDSAMAALGIKRRPSLGDAATRRQMSWRGTTRFVVQWCASMTPSTPSRASALCTRRKSAASCSRPAIRPTRRSGKSVRRSSTPRYCR